MRIRGPLIDALFVKRLNRFAVLVEVAGREEVAHLPNSGRMRELLRSGAQVLVAERTGARKTHLDLLMARAGPRLVSVDARLPPALIEEALRAGRLPELGVFERVEREVRVGSSRLDLLCHGASEPCLVEAKSVTQVQDGVALFPDAPTSRGTRHMEELRRAADSGWRAAAVFVVQRDDATSLRPFEEADPAFAAALRAAHPAVQLLAYACAVSRDEISLTRQVPVEL